MLTPKQRKQKQRLTRYVIVFCMLLIPLIVYTQRNLLSGELNLPLSSTVLIFALININGLLILLMLYLILRNLVELVFERRNKILGSHLRTRLVIAFVSLSMIPTIILFLVSLGSVSTAMEYWFNSNVEESLQSSLTLARNMFHETENRAANMGSHIGRLLEKGDVSMHDNINLQQLFNKTLSIVPLGAPDALSLINPQLGLAISAKGERLATISLPEIPSEALRKAANSKEPEIITRQVPAGELIQAIVPIQTNEEHKAFLVTTLLIPAEKLALMQSVSKGITDYKQLVMLKAPIKLSMIIMLLIITLLILFGAIWFGFFIARSMTASINKLAEGTQRVAGGDLDFTIEKESDDEMGLLVDSFNSMTSDLLKSNRELAETHKALQKSNLISEQRRRYLETILKNVAAGVIAINEHNEVTTINPFAEKLLKIDTENFLHKDFHKALPLSHVSVIESFFTDLLKSGKRSIERHLNLTVRKGETYSLLVNITRLIDEQERPIGYVIVFDNLTKLEKAQRLAAWQEVARRIAHEIKNPLTPIQLSAQRLRKRYLTTIENDREIFEQCTGTIISQVDEIKRLVTEFSDFARMPRVKKQQANIIAIAADTLVLYREGHKHISFPLQYDEVPQFAFDPVQIKRVLINLLDNAVSVLAHGGSVLTEIRLQEDDDTVRIIICDDGPGMSDQVRQRLFEPYFSTRKSGTGLGLAIANTIITEHNGVIKVHDNVPSGTVFTIELPFHLGKITSSLTEPPELQK
ncbi:two-component system, NtrC family, nitrogen regulation sensor histidine kinase NtrY [Candidatus Electrothrix aarhusensis]|uniref:histidine kinase n=1 Tax=Candidatus Electrothrix aarhusensis TaxID=1859131 RepID=A0A444IU44_9BACT|nr:two-component system, NtrC family, nitrogen regulation sensor histidine kinase NtrY [Candidatus Electrothrix aarhusensis]